jgi:hypothetical protein
MTLDDYKQILAETREKLNLISDLSSCLEGGFQDRVHYLNARLDLAESERDELEKAFDNLMFVLDSKRDGTRKRGRLAWRGGVSLNNGDIGNGGSTWLQKPG